MSYAENIRPASCCEMGSYGCQVPAAVGGRLRGIDFCIADVVAALNANGLETMASCCGHGEDSGMIALRDGRVLRIENGVRPWEREEG